MVVEQCRRGLWDPPDCQVVIAGLLSLPIA